MLMLILRENYGYILDYGSKDGVKFVGDKENPFGNYLEVDLRYANDSYDFKSTLKNLRGIKNGTSKIRKYRYYRK